MSEPMTRRGRLTAATAVGLTGVLAFGGLTLLGGQPSTASSHREAPQILGDPQADNTDTYAFVSPDNKDTVTLSANWYPFQEPNGGPNFYPFAENARYNINVDNTGDGEADIVYRWTFKNVDKRDNKTFLYNNGPVGSLKDENLLFKQRYTLVRIKNGDSDTLVKNGIAAPSFTGKASMPNYGRLQNQATRDFAKGKGRGQTYAGAADDSFALDLRVFDLLYGGDLSEVGQDTLKGYNVNHLSIQVPKKALALKGNPGRNPVIGVWASTERKTTRIVGSNSVDTDNVGDAADGVEDSDNGVLDGLLGDGPISRGANAVDAPASTAVGSRTVEVRTEWVQVSRLGSPLVNEVINAAGKKDRFNRSEPADDEDNGHLLKRGLDPEVPKLIEAIYGLEAPKAPRNDLKQIFFTGIAKNNGPIKADLNAHSLNKDVDKGDLRLAEMLRLNMGVAPTASPNRLGVLGGDLAGFPNGRRFGDDVVDIELQALMGAATKGIVMALAAGDGVNANNKPFTASFPYIALPNQQGVNTQ
ncbi:MAG: DUF4331 domain-containing protein [Sporichthyaceae bacterium]